jgi:hypothetical protein
MDIFRYHTSGISTVSVLGAATSIVAYSITGIALIGRSIDISASVVRALCTLGEVAVEISLLSGDSSAHSSKGKANGQGNEVGSQNDEQ